ncbi:hypothetical protein PVK06_020604 [Gossypium arboreum]|uniref:RNase H type-1 domain-containing protein n=1 Tax=Gossypium arboreum TaxID=29729 RepID=A0ABR0PMT5_GOSAR|nr:hypothetical protein PVK06_020604 [Gossypium arboreum]
MVDQLDNYLGLPLPIGRKKSLAFTNILDRWNCRINGWPKRLLSYGGKEIFIKAIIQAIPTYAFSVFLAPNGIIEKLHSKMCKQWWTNNEKIRGLVMLAWERMCYPKGMGGISFQDMHLFNIALLGRQVWRLMQYKDTLCFKVLSAKYFSEGDVLRPEYCEKPPFTWSSIVKVIDALKDGFLWKIGDGNSIDIPILHNGHPVIPSILRHKSWTKAPDGVIKNNVDAAVVNGNVGFANKSQDVNWAEFEAFVEGLNLALQVKVDKLIFESDSAYLVNTIKKRDQYIAILGCCIDKTCRMFRNFTSVQVNWIGRCSNKTADFLCNLAINNKCNLYFNVDYPMEIHSIIINDAIN